MANYVLAGLGGVLYALGVPNFLWNKAVIGAPILAMVLLFLLWRRAPRFGERCRLLFVFSLVANGLALYWLPQVIDHYSKVHVFLVPFVGLALIFSSFGNLWAFLILHMTLKPIFEKKQAPGKYVNPARTGAPRAIFFKADLTLFNLFLAGVLTFLEFFLPQTIPNRAGFSWLSLSPFLGLLPIFGLPVLSFLTYLSAAILSQRFISKSWDWPSLIICSSVLLINSVVPLNMSPVANPIPMQMIEGSVLGMAQRTEKARLGPLLERLPLSLLAPVITWFQPTEPSPRKFSNIVRIDGQIPFLRMRAYESLFSGSWRRQLNASTAFPKFVASEIASLHIGKFPTALAQMDLLSRWNALEFQKPLLRLSDRGEATLYDTKAGVHTHVSLGQGKSDTNLELSKANPTYYQRWGLGCFAFLWFVLLAIAWGYQRYTLSLRRPYSRAQILF